MHKTIKRFGMDGYIGDDADFQRLREQYEQLILRSMREEGYIPVIGFGPFFSTRWVQESSRYDFKISIYGVRVGRKKAWNLEGVDVDGRFQKRHTPQAK